MLRAVKPNWATALKPNSWALAAVLTALPGQALLAQPAGQPAAANPVAQVVDEQSLELAETERKALAAEFELRKRQHLRGRQPADEVPEARPPLVLEVRDMEASRRRAARSTGRKPAFEVWHAGKPINRVEAPSALEVEELPPPELPPTAKVAKAKRDLWDDQEQPETAPASEPLLPEIETRPVQELAVPQSASDHPLLEASHEQQALPAWTSRAEPPAAPVAEGAYSKEDAVEMLRQARQLAHTGSYESATWLVLRAQQVTAWTNHDVLTPDAMLLEIQGLRADDAATADKARSASAPAAPPVVVNVPAPPETGPTLMKLDWSDMRVPATATGLAIGFCLLLLIAGGALLAMVYKIMRTVVSTVFRVDMPPVQIQMNGVTTFGVPIQAGAHSAATDQSDDYDPADMDVPENPMVLPMAFAGASFADQEAQRLEEERQREADLVKCIFEKNVQLQDDLSRLEVVA